MILSTLLKLPKFIFLDCAKTVEAENLKFYRKPDTDIIVFHAGNDVITYITMSTDITFAGRTCARRVCY